MASPKNPASRKKNVLPDWWAFSFIGLQLAALLPLAYQNLFDPLQTFLGVLPVGYDNSTDYIRSSLRIEMTMQNNAHSYLMILFLFVGCTLFARNSLHGQPVLQQRIMKLPIYTGLMSDIWLFAVLALKLPSEVLWNPKGWTTPIQGIAYGLPVASFLKLLWLFGVGRDVV